MFDALENTEQTVTTVYAIEYWNEREHEWTLVASSISSTDRKATYVDMKKEYPHLKYQRVKAHVTTWEVLD